MPGLFDPDSFGSDNKPKCGCTRTAANRIKCCDGSYTRKSSHASVDEAVGAARRHIAGTGGRAKVVTENGGYGVYHRSGTRRPAARKGRR